MKKIRLKPKNNHVSYYDFNDLQFYGIEKWTFKISDDFYEVFET